MLTTFIFHLVLSLLKEMQKKTVHFESLVLPNFIDLKTVPGFSAAAVYSDLHFFLYSILYLRKWNIILYLN